jgi:hypothetical protein
MFALNRRLEMEWWNDGFETQYSNSALLQCSITFMCLASHIFCAACPERFQYPVRLPHNR